MINTDSKCLTEVMPHDSLRTINRAPTLKCTLAEVTGLNLSLELVRSSLQPE